MKKSTLAGTFGLAASLALLGPAISQAAVLPVTSSDDDGSVGTLRYVLKFANDGDVIQVPATTIVLTAAGAAALDTDGNADLDVKKNVTVLGAGEGLTIIDADRLATGAFVFEIDPDNDGVSATLEGITAQNGVAGVFVSNAGSVEVVDSSVIGNQPIGGLFVASTGGTYVVDGSTISNNIGTAGIASVGAGVTGIVSNSVVSENDSTSAGGILHVNGPLEIFNSQIVDNKSAGTAGGINAVGSLSIFNSEISRNESAGPGGGIVSTFTTHIEGSTISDNKSLNNSPGGAIFATFNLQIVDSVIADNQAQAQAGAIFSTLDTNITGSTISGNVSDVDSDGNGGGGAIFSTLSLTVNDSILKDNTANSGLGGAILGASALSIGGSVLSGNSALDGDGGGIASIGATPGNIRDTTFSGNKAAGESVFLAGSDGQGGGIASLASLALFNVTFAGNEADGNGGAYFNSVAGFASFNNVTMTGNVADANEGGLSGGNAGGLFNENIASINNSIIAGNIDQSAGSDVPDCFSDFTVASDRLTAIGVNLVQNTDGCEILGNVSDLLSGDPLFDTAGLADNAGPTVGASAASAVLQTISLQSGSPALDTGNDGSCTPADARGVDRPQGEHCDLGAFEGEDSGGTTTGEDTGGDTAGTTGGDTGGDSGGGCSLVTATSRSEHRAAVSGMIR